MRVAPFLRAGAVVVILGGVYVLRDATMSTHYATGPDTRLRVVVESAHNRSERSSTLEELTEAHLAVCGLEVNAEREGEVRPVPGTDDHFAVLLRPALDSSDRKQYRGCLEDWVVDHHQIRVVSMTDLGIDRDRNG